MGRNDFKVAVENSCALSDVVSEVAVGIKSLKNDKWVGSEGMYSNHVCNFICMLDVCMLDASKAFDKVANGMVVRVFHQIMHLMLYACQVYVC